MKGKGELLKSENKSKVSDSSTESFSYAKSYLILIKRSISSDCVAMIFISGWLMALISAEVLTFQFGQLTSKFYDLLPKAQDVGFDGSLVRLQFCRFGIFIVLMSISRGVLFGVRGLLGRSMRRNLNEFFHTKYICLTGFNKIYSNNLSLACGTGSGVSFDNPDQRITDDIESFGRGLLEIGEILFISPILVFIYTIQVSNRLTPTSVCMIYAHFVVCTLLLRFGINKLSNLTQKREELEADFRSEHVQISSNLEGFLLNNQETILSGGLKKNLLSQLDTILSTTKKLIILEGVLEFGKSLNSYSGSLLNFLLLFIELSHWRSDFDKSSAAERISLTSFLSLYLIFQLSRIAGIVDLLGKLNGQVKRLTAFRTLLEEHKKGNSNSNNTDNQSADGFGTENDQIQKSYNTNNTTTKASDFKLEISNFTGQTPAGKALNYNSVNISMKKGENLLISGENGSGKTSLLRFICGVWKTQHISTESNYEKKFVLSGGSDFKLMVCPQNPILFTGTIYDLLGLKTPTEPEAKYEDENENKFIGDTQIEEGIIKSSAATFAVLNDAVINEALQIVGLSDTNTNTNSSSGGIIRTRQEWYNTFTPGQLQRLSLARILIHRPALAALDETCVAMNHPEAMEILKQMNERGTSVILTDPNGDFEGESIFFNHFITL